MEDKCTLIPRVKKITKKNNISTKKIPFETTKGISNIQLCLTGKSMVHHC